MSNIVRFRLIMCIIVWAICMAIGHIYFAIGFTTMMLGFPLAKMLVDNFVEKRNAKKMF